MLSHQGESGKSISGEFGEGALTEKVLSNLLGISNLYSHEAIGRYIYIYMYRCGTYAENPLYNGINTKGYMTYIITLTNPNQNLSRLNYWTEQGKKLNQEGPRICDHPKIQRDQKYSSTTKHHPIRFEKKNNEL